MTFLSQILKDKKQIKVAAKEKRQILKEEINQKSINLNINDEEDDNDEEDNEDDEEEEEEDGDEEELFEDDATVSMFGSAVSVVVSDKIGDDEEDVDDGMSISTKGSANSMHSKGSTSSRGGKVLSKFDKAMRKAKGMMGKKKKHNINFDHIYFLKIIICCLYSFYLQINSNQSDSFKLILILILIIIISIAMKR